MSKQSKLRISDTTLAKEYSSRNQTPADRVKLNSCKNKLWHCKFGHTYAATPHNRTNNNSGCPLCKMTKTEKQVDELLCEIGVYHFHNLAFDDCRAKNPLRFDFIVWDDTTRKTKAIEVHGAHHYRPVKHYSKEKTIEAAKELFDAIKARDQIKRDFCQANEIELLEVAASDKQLLDKVKAFILGGQA